MSNILRSTGAAVRKLSATDRDRILGALYEHAPFAVLVSNSERRIVTCNPALEKLFGYTLEEIADRSVEILYASRSEFKRAYDAFKNVENSTDPVASTGPVELHYRKKDGEVFLASVLGSSINDDDGKHVAALGVFHNITRQKQMEHRYEHLFQYAPVFILQKDSQGRVIWINKQYAEFFGSEPDQLLGVKSSDLQPEVANFIRADDEAVLKSKTPLLGALREIQSPHRGRGWMLINKVPLVDPVTGDTTLLTIGMDVTELKRREADLESKSQELESFAYMASHDMQEPMRKISMYASILTDEESDSDDRDHAISVMTDSAQRARALIADLLAYSRANKETLDRSSVDLLDLVNAVLESHASTIDEVGADIQINVDSHIIEADRLQAELMVENLLSNALKYRKAGRPCRIEIAARKIDECAVALTVRDNGIGMDDEFLETIFRPFVRLHSRDEYPGTGIGLAICRAVAERHGWELSAKSATEGGMIFSVTIPSASIAVPPFDDRSSIQRGLPDL